MTEPVTSDPAQHRKLGRLILGIAVALAVIFVSFTLWVQQWWMFCFLLLLIPNVVVGVRELRAARKP